MAKVFKFDECSLTGNLCAELKDKYSMLIPEYLIGGFYRVIFRSTAQMLKYNSSKNVHTIGFAFKDKNGQFVYGAKLTFVAPEDEESEDGGNWNLDMTFYPADLEDVDSSLDNFNDVFLTILQTELYSAMRSHCTSNEDLNILVAEYINAIRDFLDQNSNESTEDVELVMDEVFTAGVGFEKGQKVFSLVPGTAIKQIVKNDDETEKKADNVIDISTAKKDDATTAAAAYMYRSYYNSVQTEVARPQGYYCPFVPVD